MSSHTVSRIVLFQCSPLWNVPASNLPPLPQIVKVTRTRDSCYQRKAHTGTPSPCPSSLILIAITAPPALLTPPKSVRLLSQHQFPRSILDFAAVSSAKPSTEGCTCKLSSVSRCVFSLRLQSSPYLPARNSKMDLRPPSSSCRPSASAPSLPSASDSPTLP